MAALRYILIGVVLAALGVLIAVQVMRNNIGQRAKVTIAGETFQLELATDATARERGLMGRDSIEESGGMLFIFPDSQRRSFWMGHCDIDIDLLFLNEAARIVAVHEMKAEPPQGPEETDAEYRERLPDYPSAAPAQFAIELQTGTLARLNIRAGDRVELDYRGLKQLAR